MPYYLGPYIGSGTRAIPFRPLGSNQLGWSAVDLRPDGGASLGGGGLNACLLYLPVADATPALTLIGLDPQDTLGPLVRSSIISMLKLTGLGQTRLQSIVEELLMLPPVNGWKPVQPTWDGFHEVHLGPLQSRWRQGSVGAQINDTFDRANAELLGTSSDTTWSWTEFQGTTWEIQSNTAVVDRVVAAEQLARADSDLATANHYAQAIVSTFTVTGSGTMMAAALARKANDAAVTFYYFRVLRDTANPGEDHELYKWVTGTPTLLGTNTADVTVGEVIRIECNGSSISGRKDGTTLVGPITDTGITGNTRTGIAGYIDALGMVVALNDFQAADLVAKASPTMTGSMGGWWPG